MYGVGFKIIACLGSFVSILMPGFSDRHNTDVGARFFVFQS